MSYIFLAGILIVFFVGFNIGGSTIGPAYGPAVGARAVTKTTAGVLMALFFFLGAWTIGWRVVDTLGKDLLKTSGIFTLQSSLVVLFFIGMALFCGNYFGVPASTSMTAVGSIAGLGLATQSLNWAVLGEIIIWWLVSPAIGFWVSIVCGR
ncbi:MAG: anion permease, partial [bacterium]